MSSPIIHIRRLASEAELRQQSGFDRAFSVIMPLTAWVVVGTLAFAALRVAPLGDFAIEDAEVITDMAAVPPSSVQPASLSSLSADDGLAR